MRSHGLLALLLLSALVCSLWSSDAAAALSSDGRVFAATDAGRIYRKLIYLPTTATYRFRTSQGVGGLDTVVHVVNRATGSWIRSNDDAAGGNCTDLFPTAERTSCIDIALSAGTSVVVFVHRYSNLTSGTCLFTAGVKGSAPIVSETIDPRGDITGSWGVGHSISWDANDTLQFAYTPAYPVEDEDMWGHGVLLPVVLALAGAEKVYAFGVSSASAFGDGPPITGVWGQPHLALPEASASIQRIPTSDRFYYVVGQDYWNTAMEGDGSATLYRNDAAIVGRDPDGDHLGNSLEFALGTCNQATSCPDGNPMDSDGDGLRDDWETIGGCTLFGCVPSSSDAINLAYYGGDPTIQDAFFQVDWPEPGADEVDRFGRLAGALAQVRVAYESETSSIGSPKEVIKLFFDYGQLPYGGTGGNIGPENPSFCFATSPRSECAPLNLEPCTPAEIVNPPPGTCAGNCTRLYDPNGECTCYLGCLDEGTCCGDIAEECPNNEPKIWTCPTGKSCVDLGGAPGRRCVPPGSCAYDWQCGEGESCEEVTGGGYSLCVPSGGCESACEVDPLVHTDYYGQDATYTPYNLEHVMRGDPALPHAFLPLNRRGIFGELWLQSSFPGEGDGLWPSGFAAQSSCCVLSGCDSTPYSECQDLFPGWIARAPDDFLVSGSSLEDSTAAVVTFHETGHLFGLTDGWLDVQETSCFFDADCAHGSECWGGRCVGAVTDVPNHVSLMNYNFTGWEGVDLKRLWSGTNQATLDFSSGDRESVQGFADRGVSCDDPGCPLSSSPQCPIPAPLWEDNEDCCWEDYCVVQDFGAVACDDPSCPALGAPGCLISDPTWEPEEKCCLEGVCVAGALDESDGIGDYFELGYGGASYQMNRDFQLWWLGYCIHNNDPDIIYGAQPAYPFQDLPELDWNQNGSLDASPVGAFLFNPDWPHECGPWNGKPEQSNVRLYPDVDEWGRMAEHGFRYFGINQQPSMATVPICGASQGVSCPTGYDCSYGRCTLASEGYLPPQMGQSAP